ncbi:MAG: chitobiase/beta-hexosaminidase C-terminal domain-containing protein [Mediterraneibacter faecis]
MRCTHCGANIPDDQLICPVCGAEVQIVPDYNPLEDVLAREVKGSVAGATRQIQADVVRRQNMSQNQQNRNRQDQRSNPNSTRVLSQAELDKVREERREQLRRQRAQRQRQKTDAKRYQDARQSTENLRRTSTESRRLQQIKNKRLPEKRQKLLTVFFLLILLVGVGIYIGYQNSYTGMIKKGNAALQNSNYTSAENYFNRAIIKDKSKAEAYTGLANIYVAQDDLDSAESVYLNALETQPSNVNLYKAAVKFYEKTEQPNKISDLLQDCEDKNVLSAMNDYVSSAPEFSLKEGTYDEVQQVTLTSATGGTIYYTTDGSDPTESSTEYKEAVLLQSEGDTEIRAIAVNKKGIPSAVSSAKYSIEFPLVDAPAVSPSTGQYSTATQITITVPDGYTAYYTMDGSTPTASSEKYTDPIDMPENSQTTFSAILVNDKNGKATEVTTRNYITTY